MELTVPIFEAAHEAQKRGEPVQHRPNFGTVFYGHAEIQGALETLELISTLMLRAPPRAVSVNKTDYLRFLIGAYLQEVYILRERLIQYAKKFKRIYKPQGALGTRLDDMAKVVENAFDQMTAHRGQHVHQERYADKDLNYMAMLFTVAKSAKHLPALELSAYSREAAKHYRTQSRKWAKLVSGTLESLNVLLDAYFGAMLQAATSNGTFEVPETASPQQARYVRGAAKSR